MGKNDKETAGDAPKAGAGAGEVVKALAPEVMKRVEALSELQSKFSEQHAAYVEEYKALQRKYHDIHTDLYAKRSEIVNGKVDPAGAAEGAAKGIEGFWLQALQNGRRTGPTIEEHDEPALKSLVDVTMEYFDDFQGFKLIFHFAPNDYFTDDKLVKTFHIPHMMGGGRLGSDPTIEKIEGCEVHWKAGKDLTEKEVKKTTKKKGKKVTVTKKEPQESFFRFFETPNMEADEDMEPEDAYELQAQIHMEMEVGFEIKNKIIPRAVDWFTGEAVEDESSDEDDEDYEDEDEEDDEGDYTDDEEEEKPKKGGKGAKGKKGKADDDDDEEDGDDEDREAMAAALAQAFAKGMKGGKGAKAGKKGKAEDEEDDEEEEGKPAPGGGKDGEKPPECKQQ